VNKYRNPKSAVNFEHWSLYKSPFFTCKEFRRGLLLNLLPCDTNFSHKKKKKRNHQTNPKYVFRFQSWIYVNFSPWHLNCERSHQISLMISSFIQRVRLLRQPKCCCVERVVREQQYLECLGASSEFRWNMEETAAANKHLWKVFVLSSYYSALTVISLCVYQIFTSISFKLCFLFVWLMTTG